MPGKGLGGGGTSGNSAMGNALATALQGYVQIDQQKRMEEAQAAQLANQKRQADIEAAKAGFKVYNPKTQGFDPVDPQNFYEQQELQKRKSQGETNKIELQNENEKAGLLNKLQEGGYDTSSLEKATGFLRTGKQLAPDKVLQVNEAANINRGFDDVEKLVNENQDLFGPFKGRLGSADPYNTQAQVINAGLKARSQAFGRWMEGGVLRKEDEEKYAKMFPTLTDTPEVAAGKMQLVRRMAAQKQAGDLNALKAQGYNTRGFLNPQAPELVNVQQQKGGLLDRAKNFLDSKQEQTAPANTPQVKVFNGIRYQKVEGGWQRIK